MDTDNLASWLLEQGSHRALQWLQEMLAGRHPVPADFNWQGLAECAASDANPNRRNAFTPNLEWAYVAALAYTRLIEEEKKSSRLAHKPELKKNIYTSYSLKLMRVRVNAILAFGPAPDDLVRDVSYLIQTFFEDISLSPQDFLDISTGKKKEQSFEDRIELHWLKQKLQVLQSLRKKHLLPEDQDLALWFSAWDQVLAAYKQSRQ